MVNWGKSSELALSQSMFELDQKIGLSQVFKIEKKTMNAFIGMQTSIFPSYEIVPQCSRQYLGETI